jgi:hypothetical protein
MQLFTNKFVCVTLSGRILFLQGGGPHITSLKEGLPDEWGKITIQEVRARIAEMPSQCKSLVKTGGLPIKSELW